MENEQIREKAPIEINKDEKSDSVLVKREVMEKLLNRIDRLEYAASKAQLAHWDSKIVKDKTKEASVSTYEDKIIVAWRMVEDIVEKVNGVWMEKQTIEVIFDNDEKELIPYVQFIKRTQRKKIKVLSETKTSEGLEIWKVETIENGLTEPKQFEIDIRFIN